MTFAFTNDAATPHDFKIEKGGKEVDGTQVISQDEEEFTSISRRAPTRSTARSAPTAGGHGG